jgi:uncharacterized protein (DUF983 family)
MFERCPNCEEMRILRKNKTEDMPVCGRCATTSNHGRCVRCGNFGAIFARDINSIRLCTACDKKAYPHLVLPEGWRTERVQRLMKRNRCSIFRGLPAKI